jgi:hypothetical protein
VTRISRLSLMGCSGRVAVSSRLELGEGLRAAGPWTSLRRGR